MTIHPKLTTVTDAAALDISKCKNPCSRVARPLAGRVAERQEGAFASLFDQRGVSPLQVGALRPVSESNCVAVRRGGKQLEENDQSVTLCELDSVGLSGEPAFLW